MLQQLFCSGTSLFFCRLALLLSDLALTLFCCNPLCIQALALDRLTLLLGGLELDLLCRQALLFSGGADLFCRETCCVSGLFRAETFRLFFHGGRLGVHELLLQLGHHLIALLFLSVSFFGGRLTLTRELFVIALFLRFVRLLSLLLHLVSPALNCRGLGVCVGACLFLDFLMGGGGVLLKQTLEVGVLLHHFVSLFLRLDQF